MGEITRYFAPIGISAAFCPQHHIGLVVREPYPGCWLFSHYFPTDKTKYFVRGGSAGASENPPHRSLPPP